MEYVYNINLCSSKDKNLFEQSQIMLNFIRNTLLVHNMLFIIKTCYRIYYNCYSSRLHICFLNNAMGVIILDRIYWWNYVVTILEYGTLVKGKDKVFHGQEPPSGESTTTECGFNYQLHAVIY